jgi:epsilon-lactone hydrolase
VDTTIAEPSPARTAFPVPSSVSPEAQQWLALQLPRTQYPPLDDTAAWLSYVDQMDSYVLAQFGSVIVPVSTEKSELGGVPTYVLRSGEVAKTDSGPVYLDIHGGGLIMGGGELVGLMASGTALSTGMTTYSIDYRMPPLHPYPAALDDCVAAYRALLESHDPEDVFVGGGSAGGNLAAALMLRARDEGLPLPAGLVLFTPEVDLTESGDSFAVNADADHVLGSLREVNLLYAAGHDLTDPYLSPLFGDVTGFPPTLLQTGTRDLFLSNTVRMHRKLRNSGVAAELNVYEAMPHGGFGGASPEDREIAVETRRFLDRLRRQ